MNDASGTIAVGGTAQQLLAAATSRRGLTIQNLDSTAALWVRLDGAGGLGWPGVIRHRPRGWVGRADGLLRAASDANRQRLQRQDRARIHRRAVVEVVAT